MIALPPVIGFCGAAGAGKSTAAHWLTSRHGYRRERFAGPLKDMLRAFGLTAAEVDGDRKETPLDVLCGRTPRQAMQFLGKEWGRDLLGPDVWVAAWSRRADAIGACGGTVVADDVRFLNEAQAIRARGGVVVRIRRDGAASASGAGHASEAMGFQWDFEIVNPGADLRALYDVLDAWLMRLPARALTG